MSSHARPQSTPTTTVSSGFAGDIAGESVEAPVPPTALASRVHKPRFTAAQLEHIRGGDNEDPGFVDRVLSRAGTGVPGLSEERKLWKTNSEELVVAYRDPLGTPVAVATILPYTPQSEYVREAETGEPPRVELRVKDLALDRSRGLLSGRALLAVVRRLEELNATTPLSTVTQDARRLQIRLAAAAGEKGAA